MSESYNIMFSRPLKDKPAPVFGVMFNVDLEWYTYDEFVEQVKASHRNLNVGQIGIVRANTRMGTTWNVTLTINGGAAVANYWVVSALHAGTRVGFEQIPQGAPSALVACVQTDTTTQNDHKYIWIGTYTGGTSSRQDETYIPSEHSDVFRRSPMFLMINRNCEN